MEPAPLLEDLVRLFESEPTYPRGQDAPWYYLRSRFTLTRGRVSVQVELEPASAVIDVRLSAAGAVLVELQLSGVRSATVHEDSGRELLQVLFEDWVGMDSLWLRTEPDLSLTWQMERED